jgi:hypothetical protein
MTVGEYAEQFFGLPVVEFRTGEKATRKDVVYRLMQDYDAEQSQTQFLDEFLEQVDSDRLEALVIGPWGEASTGTPPKDYLDVLISRRLPKLRAIYVGDMTFEDAEMSWINQADYTDFLAAYPNLEVLRIRGGEALQLPVMQMRNLRELAIETGGMPTRVVQAIASSSLPALRKLELWLGTDHYGFDGDLSTCTDLLAKIQPERLEYLGLRNSDIADQLAGFLAAQPWLASLHTLDLSMGTLGDIGAKALLSSRYLAGLKTLDLRHHYISPELVKKLEALRLELVIDEAEDAGDDEEDRYVQVGE